MTKKCQSKDSNQTKEKRKWLASEDQLLLKEVESYQNRNVKPDWQKIASKLQPIFNRIGKQCRERYVNHLKPELNKNKWSRKEDEILLLAHQDVGNAWSEITKQLPGRTDHAIKNRFNYLKRHKRVKPETSPIILKIENEDFSFNDLDALLIPDSIIIENDDQEVDLDLAYEYNHLHDHAELNVSSDSMTISSPFQNEKINDSTFYVDMNIRYHIPPEIEYDLFVTTLPTSNNDVDTKSSDNLVCEDVINLSITTKESQELKKRNEDLTICNEDEDSVDSLQQPTIAIDLDDALSFYINTEFPSRSFYLNSLNYIKGSGVNDISTINKCSSPRPRIFTPLCSPSKNISTFRFTNPYNIQRN